MNPVTGLSVARLGVGAVALARPDFVARMLQLDPAASPQVPFAIRLFGSRDAVLGLATLLGRGRTRRSLTLACVAVDGADAATSYLAVRDGSLSRSRAVAVAAPALGAVAVGIAAALPRRP